MMKNVNIDFPVIKLISGWGFIPKAQSYAGLNHNYLR